MPFEFGFLPLCFEFCDLKYIVQYSSFIHFKARFFVPVIVIPLCLISDKVIEQSLSVRRKLFGRRMVTESVLTFSWFAVAYFLMLVLKKLSQFFFKLNT